MNLVRTEVIDKVPYVDQQVLTFIKSTGDTLLVTVRRSQDFMNDNCVECYCNTTESELIGLSLISDSVSLLSMNIWADDPRVTFAGKISGFELWVNPTGEVRCDSSMIICLDSLTVQGVYYQNVYQLEHRFTTLPDLDITRLFYQAEKGLLRVDYKDGTKMEVL
ncbi:MAG: hypothetical protein ABIO24_09105 [Saprospiraceae bacterium]